MNMIPMIPHIGANVMDTWNVVQATRKAGIRKGVLASSLQHPRRGWMLQRASSAACDLVP
ncbi:MAG: hypothetical protein OXC01_17190 [Immundisolibacterales bacterium]|nr:hypothetical protein [Immundisolibacterales bacterium]